ncbi:MAG: hypothetical protein V1874_02795 [Spirochaetota bacterium]
MKRSKLFNIFSAKIFALILLITISMPGCDWFSSGSDSDDENGGQPDEVTKTAWSKTYGHGDTYTEYHAYGFDATGDGGYVFASQNVYNGAGGYDFWIVRLNSEGSLVWEKGFGGENGEEPFVVRQTSDGGFIAAGESWSFRTGTSYCDAWVIKLSVSGGVEWQRSYGGTGVDAFSDVKETFDSNGDSTGFLLCGNTNSFGSGGYDAWIVKINTSGLITHEEVIGGSQNEFGRSVALTSDGGCILLADTQSFGAGNRDVWLVKLDSSYSVEWEKAYGGTDVDFPRTVVCSGDGGYVVGSYTESFGAGENDYWILKVDSDGDIVWQYTYGGTDGDIAYDLQKTNDGGYIMTGWTYSFGAGFNDAWLVKLNGSGVIQWQKRYNITYTDGTDTWSGSDWAYRVIQTADGGYAIAGDSDDVVAVRNGDAWIFRVDSTGTLGCDMAADTDAVGNGTATVTVTDTSGDSVMSSTSANVDSTSASGYSASPEVITQCDVQ